MKKVKNDLNRTDKNKYDKKDNEIFLSLQIN